MFIPIQPNIPVPAQPTYQTSVSETIFKIEEEQTDLPLQYVQPSMPIPNAVPNQPSNVEATVDVQVKTNQIDSRIDASMNEFDR